ncbi:MAG: alpha/beta hydrolase [Pseudomonadota bacterium]
MLSDTLATIDVCGVKTAYMVAGQGHPIVYLHGAATLEGFSFLESLTDRFRVIVPYHPGYGPGQDGDGLLGAQDLIVHYMDFIEAIGLERPHLFGFSMGGWLAAELAIFYGEHLGSIVLAAPAGLEIESIPCPDLGDIPLSEFPAYLAHNVSVAERFFPGGEAAPDEAVFDIDRARDAKAEALLARPFGMGHPNMERWLRRIKNSVKIYWGKEDRMVPAAYLDRWLKALPGAEHMLIGNAGHFVMLEQPAVLNDVAAYFTRVGV